MRSLENRISEESTPELLQAYDQLQEHFHQMNGYAAESRAKEILTGLGFKDSDFLRPVSEFSGGWHMRIALAKILLQEPDCLMLDEPDQPFRYGNAGLVRKSFISLQRHIDHGIA